MNARCKACGRVDKEARSEPGRFPLQRLLSGAGHTLEVLRGGRMPEDRQIMIKPQVVGQPFQTPSLGVRVRTHLPEELTHIKNSFRPFTQFMEV